MNFDSKRAFLRGPDLFARFRVPDRGQPLASAGLAPAAVLIVAERGGVQRAFAAAQLAYHHVAQGRLAGHPYLVVF